MSKKQGKGLKKVHNTLTQKVGVYKTWHEFKHSGKVHFVFLFVYALGIAALLTSLLFTKTQNVLAEATHLTVSPAGYTNIDDFTITLAGDPIVGATKYQYRTGEDDPTVGWVDFNPVISDSVTLPNANHPNGKYTEGENFFYFRALDIDSNVLESLQKTFFYSISPPSPPSNPVVTPANNTLNSFTLSWNTPSAYGDLNKIKYYYSINALPTANNVTEVSSLSVGPGPFAQQVGENFFYVVAKDEAGNIDYSQYAGPFSFWANTIAPGIPTGIIIDDISDKDNSQYRLAISWTPPVITDALNWSGYDVYGAASVSGPYTRVAHNILDTAYVNTNLVQNSVHYYYVVATDKTGHVSAHSSTVHATADGHYTVAPNVTKEPTVSNKSTTASINWGTAREANSYIEYGRTSLLGMSVGNGATIYSTNHTVLMTGLNPGVKYYYKTTFTDPDGNTGQSEIGEFTTNTASTISNFVVDHIGTTTATVTFDTNTPSHGDIYYKNEPFTGEIKIPEDTTPVTKHYIEIIGLKDGTEYYFHARETDDEGNVFTSDNYEAYTLPQPKVSDLVAQGKKDVNSPTISVSYKTNVATSTLVHYTGGGINRDYADSALTKDHLANLENLNPLIEYTINVSGEDKFGNKAQTTETKVTTLSDTMPPRIMNFTEKVKVIGEGANAYAQLTVHVAVSEMSTMVLEAGAGIDTESYSVSSSIDSLALEHTIILKLDKPGVPYSYRIKLVDNADNVLTTSKRAIVVPPANQNVLGYVLGAFSKSFGWLGKYIKI